MKNFQEQNSLYEYISDHGEQFRSPDFNIERSNNANHEAFYIKLAPSTFKKTLKKSVWLFKEHHITVEKLSMLGSRVMTPFHYTLRFDQRNNAKKMVIHAYFDQKLKLIHFQKKISELSGDTWSDSVQDIDNHSSESIDNQIELTLNDIRHLATLGKDILSDLLAEKSKFYMALSTDVYNADVALAKAQLEGSNVSWQKKIELIQKYITLIRKLNRFSDSNWNNSEPYLQSLLQSVRKKSQRQSAEELTNALDQQNTRSDILRLTINTNAKQTPETVSDQENIEKLVAELREAESKPKSLKKIKTINRLIEQISIALSAFNIEHSSKESRTFLKNMYAKLYQNKQQALSTFEEKVLSGDLSAVRQYHDGLDAQIDWVHLFIRLLDKMEAHGEVALTDKLIDVAHFFYDSSELYRSVLMVRQLYTKYIPAIGVNFDVDTSMLTRMYLDNKLNVFRCYLAQGISPELPHFRWGRYAFNALQSVVMCDMLMGNETSRTSDYIDLLFEYHAKMECSVVLLPETVQEYAAIPIQEHVEGSSTGFVKKILTKTPVTFNSRRYRTDANLFFSEELLLSNNILDFALCFPARSPTLEHITDYVRHDILYLAFLATIKRDDFNMLMWVSYQGGASFHANKEMAGITAQRSEEQLSAEQNNKIALSRIYSRPDDPRSDVVDYRFRYALNTTLRTYIFPGAGDDDISTIQYLYNRFYTMFSVLAREDQLAFVKNIYGLAIQTRLQKSENPEIIAKNALLYLGAIIALSLVNPLYEEDYRWLIRLLYEHGERTDALHPESQRKQTLCANARNAHALFGRLTCLNPLGKITTMDPKLREEKIFDNSFSQMR